MKYSTAVLLAVVYNIEAVKIDRTALREGNAYDFQRHLRFFTAQGSSKSGKGSKGSGEKVDDVCFSVCAANCTITADPTATRDGNKFHRDLRFDGKGKSGKGNGEKVDEDCLADCAATCVLPNCIPLDATAAPTKGKGGKGKNKFGMTSKGNSEGSSTKAPVSEKFGMSSKGKGKGSSSEAPVSQEEVLSLYCVREE